MINIKELIINQVNKFFKKKYLTKSSKNILCGFYIFTGYVFIIKLQNIIIYNFYNNRLNNLDNFNNLNNLIR